MINVENFSTNFEAWRAKAAAKENIFLETAINIANFVNKQGSLQEIDEKFSSGKSSEAYASFSQYNLQNKLARLYGMAVFMKLVVEEYRKETLATGEDKILVGLQNNLAKLYESPLWFLSYKDLIIDGFRTWLNKFATTTPVRGFNFGKQSPAAVSRAI